MKKYLQLLMMALGAICVISLASCRKDKDSDKPSIVGTWEKLHSYNTHAGERHYLDLRPDGTCVTIDVAAPQDGGEVRVKEGEWNLNDEGLMITPGSPIRQEIYKVSSNRLVMGFFGFSAEWRRVPASDIEPYLKKP